MFIHGKPRPETGSSRVVRRKVNFQDEAHPFVVLDIDRFDHDSPDPASAAAAIRERLPEAFRKARCVWSATSGHEVTPGKARLRLVFWSDRELTPTETSAWVADSPVPCDRSIYRTVQPVYLANPIIVGGKDHVKKRWGLLDGEPSVSAGRPARQGEADRRPNHDRAGGRRHQRAEVDPAIRQRAAPQRRRRDRRARQPALGPDGLRRGRGGFGDRPADHRSDPGVLVSARLLRAASTTLAALGIDPKKAAELAAATRRFGEDVEDRIATGDELDISIVAKKVDEAFAYRSTPFGSLYAAQDDGSDFSAVTDDEPQAQAGTDGDDPLTALRLAVLLDDNIEAAANRVAETLDRPRFGRRDPHAPTGTGRGAPRRRSRVQDP